MSLAAITQRLKVLLSVTCHLAGWNGNFASGRCDEWKNVKTAWDKWSCWEMDRSFLDSVYNEAINIRFKERRKKKTLWNSERSHTLSESVCTLGGFCSPRTRKACCNDFNFLKLHFGLIIGQERKTKTFDACLVRDLVAYIKNVD